MCNARVTAATYLIKESLFFVFGGRAYTPTRHTHNTFYALCYFVPTSDKRHFIARNSETHERQQKKKHEKDSLATIPNVAADGGNGIGSEEGENRKEENLADTRKYLKRSNLPSGTL